MTTWTPERVAAVTRLWNEGLTTAEIGRMIGVSKNAVVGKAHRLQLPARPSPIKRGKSVRPKHTVAVPRPAKPRPVQQFTVGNAACKWPIGHPDEPGFHFCGERALVSKPYCQNHYEKAYIPAKPRSDAA
jgi:GcrA cell cycle regulator